MISKFHVYQVAAVHSLKALLELFILGYQCLHVLLHLRLALVAISQFFPKLLDLLCGVFERSLLPVACGLQLIYFLLGFLAFFQPLLPLLVEELLVDIEVAVLNRVVFPGVQLAHQGLD
mmetsp:Transcript_6344/g.7431  ORF Transcript_6344/g.7431 Transcript_6344/m.7431 type:complete len:119 (-) Transcript_6344:848-1204(-)